MSRYINRFNMISDIIFIPHKKGHYRVRQKLDRKEKTITLTIIEMKEGYNDIILSEEVISYE